MPTNTKAQRRLDAALDQAEARGSCLAPATRADDAALKRRLPKGEVISPAPGIFARPEYWLGLHPDERALSIMRALGEKHPAWIFRSSSAALAWGLDVPYPLALPVKAFAACQPAAVCDNLAVTPIHHQLPREMVGSVGDLRVTSFWESVLECLLEAPFSWGLAVADSALRASGWNAEQLVEFVRTAGKGRPGVRRALITASYADGRAESGGESRLRALIIVHGFQIPELQVEIPDPTDPTCVYRVDHFWKTPDGRRVANEMDGFCKYEDEAMLDGRTPTEVLVAERQRESRLTLAGVTVLRFTYDDLQHPQKIDHLLTVAGVPRDMGAARAWREAWDAADPQAGNR